MAKEATKNKPPTHTKEATHTHRWQKKPKSARYKYTHTHTHTHTHTPRWALRASISRHSMPRNPLWTLRKISRHSSSQMKPVPISRKNHTADLVRKDIICTMASVTLAFSLHFSIGLLSASSRTTHPNQLQVCFSTVQCIGKSRAITKLSTTAHPQKNLAVVCLHRIKNIRLHGQETNIHMGTFTPRMYLLEVHERTFSSCYLLGVRESTIVQGITCKKKALCHSENSSGICICCICVASNSSDASTTR